MSLIVLVAPPLSIRFSASAEKIDTLMSCENNLLLSNLAHTLFSTVNSDIQLLEEEEDISDWRETLSWLSLTTVLLDLHQRYVDP